MAMNKKAPAKKKASASGSDRGAKMKADAAQDAYLRKGPRSFYADGQMITEMSELKRLQKRLAKRELELKAREAKTVKRKER